MSTTAERAVRGRRRLRARLGAALAALGLVAVIGVAQTAGTTEASWSDSTYGHTTLTAGTLGAPGRPVNGCSIAGSTFTPRWTAPASPSVAPAGYQYRLYWKGLITPEVLVSDWSDPIITETEFSYPIPASILRSGAYRFEVRAVSGSWQSASITGTATVLVSLLGVISIDACSWS